MGFLDSVKKATGIGLDAQERYALAFEKGVLLGRDKYDEAIEMFEKAAEQAGEEGNEALKVQALANAWLYRFILTGHAGVLSDLRKALSRMDQIEQIGSQSQFMPAETLCSEIEARLAENILDQIPKHDHSRLAEAHERVSKFFKPLFTTNLITYAWQSPDRHTETGQPRFFLHQALSMWHRAHQLVRSDPEEAAENMAKAIKAFRQCEEHDHVEQAQAWLETVRKRRTCWMCHREVQGEGIHYSTHSATITPYVADRLEEMGQDTQCVDLAEGRVVLCRVCGSVVERSAKKAASQMVKDVQKELSLRISDLNAQIQRLTNRRTP